MNPCSEWPCHTLPTFDTKPYLSIAFDGCFYYLTMPQDKHIYKFDSNFSSKAEFKGNRCYSGLCYDSLEDCFWATSSTQHDKIYKLNGKLQEIDCISFENTRCDYRQILGISYDCAKNLLLLAFKDAIFEITKEAEVKEVLKIFCSAVLNVVSLAPYLAVAINDGKKQSILYYQGDKLVKSETIPLVYRIRDIVYNPCKPALMLLVTKHCQYPRILCCPLNLKLDSCHKVLCDKECKPMPPKAKHSIIDSVAKMETALSHILNAEGEKLQKGIELAGSVDELLEINQSVQKTLIFASQLEHILYAKLQAAMELKV